MKGRHMSGASGFRHGLSGLRRSVSRSAAIWLIAGLALASPTLAQSAYTVAGSNLYRLDLQTAELTLLGDLGVSGILALATDPSGALYGVTADDLYTVNPGVPSVSLVGPLNLIIPSFRPNSLTFDAEGRLWMLVSGRLHEIDPMTGEATAIVMVEQGLITMAADGVQLYGVRIGAEPPPNGTTGSEVPLAVKIDRETGGVEILAPLDGLLEESPGGVDAMMIDDQGQRWLMAINDIPIAPPETVHRLYRAANFESGELEFVSQGMEFGVSAQLDTLALAPDQEPGQGVVDIPTLSPVGLALLCSLIAIGAFGILRRSCWGA